MGGPFTRKDPAMGNMSCLDMFIISRELLPYVKKLRIDSKREMAVCRAVKRGGQYEMVYSDNFTSLLTISNLPRENEIKQQKQTVWNLSKEGGWNMVIFIAKYRGIFSMNAIVRYCEST